MYKRQVLSTVRHQHLDPADDYPVDRAEPEPALRPAGSTAHRAITEAWSNVVGLQLMTRLVVPLLAVSYTHLDVYKRQTSA